ASMGVPADDGKLPFAVGLAAGLAYVALRQNNPVRVILLSDGAGSRLSPLFRHAQRLPDLLQFLGSASAHGPTRLDNGIDAYMRSTQLPGTAAILSDFLVEPSVYEGLLDRLRAAETGVERLVDLTADHRSRYARAVEDHLTQLTRWCAARAIGCAAVDT